MNAKLVMSFNDAKLNLKGPDGEVIATILPSGTSMGLLYDAQEEAAKQGYELEKNPAFSLDYPTEWYGYTVFDRKVYVDGLEEDFDYNGDILYKMEGATLSHLLSNENAKYRNKPFCLFLVDHKNGSMKQVSSHKEESEGKAALLEAVKRHAVKRHL